MTTSRRNFFKAAAGLAAARAVRGAGLPEIDIPIAAGPYSPDGSFESFQCPEWFRDAKFGIWAHWGPSSAIGDGDWYARNMYMEGSPQYEYHLRTYGHPSKFGYKDTIPLWKAEAFDPLRSFGAMPRPAPSTSSVWASIATTSICGTREATGGTR
jgi:alpha-L-fucosidase